MTIVIQWHMQSSLQIEQAVTLNQGTALTKQQQFGRFPSIVLWLKLLYDSLLSTPVMFGT